MESYQTRCCPRQTSDLSKEWLLHFPQNEKISEEGHVLSILIQHISHTSLAAVDKCRDALFKFRVANHTGAVTCSLGDSKLRKLSHTSI
jgi:hypothetical protein